MTIWHLLFLLLGLLLNDHTSLAYFGTRVIHCFILLEQTLSCEIFALHLGPKTEDVSEPVNPLVFLARLILGALAGAYYVLVPVYMWLKDQIVPKGQTI